jgi:predicted nucleic acid-binding protein
LVLAEASWVLSAVFSRTALQIGEALAQLLEHESLVVQGPDVVALAFFPRAEEACSRVSDCLILEIARKAGNVPLGTFDRDLGRVNGATKLKG